MRESRPKRSEAERKVLGLLRGGRALSHETRQELVAALGAEERRVLRRIASGELAAEDPKVRKRAIAALGMLPPTAESRAVLRGLLGSPDPSLGVRAVQALERQDVREDLPRLRELVRHPGTHPATALAAARVAAAHGGTDAVADLLDLRRRLLPLVRDERSPSVAALDRLIEEARGERAPSPPGPGPIA